MAIGEIDGPKNNERRREDGTVEVIAIVDFATGLDKLIQCNLNRKCDIVRQKTFDGAGKVKLCPSAQLYHVWA